MVSAENRVVLLCFDPMHERRIQAVLEQGGYIVTATSDPAKAVRAIEECVDRSIVLTDTLGVNPVGNEVLSMLNARPELRRRVRVVGLDMKPVHHLMKLGLDILEDFISTPFSNKAVLDLIKSNFDKLPVQKAQVTPIFDDALFSDEISFEAPHPQTCSDDACSSLASYTCNICHVPLCLVHAFPQCDEDGWFCGPCVVMPKWRQEFWEAEFDAEWWSRVGVGEQPYDLRGEEPDMDPWEESSDEHEEDESQDLLDHLEEDLDGLPINTWALAREEVDRDYEEEDWQEPELERDVYDDDDDYDAGYDDSDDDYGA